MDIKQIGRDLIALLAKHACYGKRVAAIVTWSGKDDDGCSRVPTLSDYARHSLRSTLHQINRPDRLVLYRICVELMYLSPCEYLHTPYELSSCRTTMCSCRAKIQNYY